MPNESINLYIAMSSGGSERTLTSLADKTRELDKETQQLQRNLEEKITPPRRGRRECVSLCAGLVEAGIAGIELRDIFAFSDLRLIESFPSTFSVERDLIAFQYFRVIEELA